jgi:hypothetical protein
MFGTRNKYKEYFQLWIPAELIESWSKCFMFHKLAVEAVRSGKGVPVWLSDHKTIPTSPASIDRSSVDFEGGEMSFAMFEKTMKAVEAIMILEQKSDIDKLQALREVLSGDQFPDYIFEFISEEARLADGEVCFHSASEFGSKSKSYTKEEIANIRRKKGIFSTNEFKRGSRPNARHHLKVFFNSNGKARLYYKINGHAVKFIQNRR